LYFKVFELKYFRPLTEWDIERQRGTERVVRRHSDTQEVFRENKLGL
jgi:hypothetical protein